VRAQPIQVEVEQEASGVEASGVGLGVPTHSDLTLTGMIPTDLKELVINLEEVEVEVEDLEEEAEAEAEEEEEVLGEEEEEEVLEAEEGLLMHRLDLSKMSRHSLRL
jgi:hypothetical protein